MPVSAVDVLFTKMTNQGKMTKEDRKPEGETDGQYEYARTSQLECGGDSVECSNGVDDEEDFFCEVEFVELQQIFKFGVFLRRLPK